MNKVIKIIVIFITIIIGIFFIYKIIEKKEENNLMANNEKFKKEYEELNGKVNENNQKAYLDVEVNTNINIKYQTEEEAIDIIKNGTGVIYLGFPECPWCRNIVPVLLDAVSETSLEEIYYVNIRNIRDKKTLDAAGNIVVEKEGTSGYNKLLQVLNDYLTPYDGLNDETIKRLYAPTVLFIRDGTVLNLHISTVESQTDPYIPLNENQKQELKNIYLQGIHKTLNDLCDESC